MSTPPENQMLRMDGWPGGINNRVRETEQSIMRDGEAIPSSQFLRHALNVDLTAEGHPLRRKGYALQEAGFAHSAWYCREQDLFYVVISGELKVGKRPNEFVTIDTVNRYLPMSYTWFVDRVFFSNGATTGSFSAELGWVEWPDQNNVTELPREYGGSISLQAAPSFDIDSDNAYYEVLPAGQLLAAHKGRLYVAENKNIWFSQPAQPDFMRTATNLFMWPSTIEMLQPVEGGIFVGTAHDITFIAGSNPFKTERISVYPHGVVPKAFARIPGEKFGMGTDYVPVWWCKDGVMLLGMPTGQIRQLTRDRLSAPEYGFGAVSMREREGISQIVSSLQKGGDANNMAATDTVVAEIRRNNITLNP